MSRVDRSGVEYIGADTVAELVARSWTRFGDAGTRFIRCDLTRDRLPRVDVVMVRDCLVHLSLPLVWAALRRIKESGSTYLMATTYPDHHENRNIPTGRWQALNLQDPPFSLPPPEFAFQERCTEKGGARADKTLAAWQTADLPDLPPTMRLHPSVLHRSHRRRGE